MHRNRAFAWEDEAAMRDFVAQAAFAHLFVSGPAGVAVAHAPVLVTESGALQFHLARGNRVTPLIAGASILASIAAHDFYVSPDWYAADDQVPTWDYVAVEAEGTASPLDEAGLAAHLDALSLEHERRLSPKPVWTRAKMTPGRFEAMLRGLAGFELRVDCWRGTRKLSQNKAEADVLGVVAALAAQGRATEAALVRDARG